LICVLMLALAPSCILFAGPSLLSSASHSETSSAAGSGDESDSSASRKSVEMDRKDAGLPRRLSDPNLQAPTGSNRPPSPGGSSTATSQSVKKETKRGSVFGNLFEKKDKDKEAAVSGAKEAHTAASSAGGEPAAADSASSRFKFTGNFFDKKDKDAKGADDQKEKEGKEKEGGAALPVDRAAPDASASNGSGSAAASSSTSSSSRFKLNLNLGFGS
jgi:hypothetical protein